MNFLLTARIALRALVRNKMRSFLTTLGVVIGVAAVIAMVAIGEGAQARVEQTFASMGANLLIILPGTTTRGGAFGGFGSMPTLTWDDLEAIKTQCPAVQTAAAVLQAAASVQSEDTNWTTSVAGTSPEYFAVRRWEAAHGSLLTAADVDSATKVAVLGQTVVEKLFGTGIDPVGQPIRIKNIPFVVQGVLAKKGQSPVGQDFDDAVFVPQTTFQTKIRGGLANLITGVIFVSATSAQTTSRAQTEITELLRERHNIRPGLDDDFSLRNLAEMANAQQQGTKTLTTLLASIAAISLLVGGIGIMNIMLVSVTERTREIGIRMSVGAKPRAILFQFLVESLALALVGGCLGIATGLLAASRLATAFGWPLLVRPSVMLLAVGFSGLVGLVFGLYPARKAALLDPIEALRYE